jgi:hypothetical protein
MRERERETKGKQKRLVSKLNEVQVHHMQDLRQARQTEEGDLERRIYIHYIWQLCFLLINPFKLVTAVVSSARHYYTSLLHTRENGDFRLSKRVPNSTLQEPYSTYVCT